MAKKLFLKRKYVATLIWKYTHGAKTLIRVNNTVKPTSVGLGRDTQQKISELISRLGLSSFSEWVRRAVETQIKVDLEYLAMTEIILGENSNAEEAEI